MTVPLGSAAVRTLEQLRVPARFNGPPGSANGGYVGGLLALARRAARSPGATPPEGGATTVTLREPPPLQVGIDLALDGDVLVATLGGALIATAGPGLMRRDPVAPVPVEVARAAEERYAGLAVHPFPACFVCGPARPAGDGMGLRPGRVGAGPDAPVACTWTPVDDLRSRVIAGEGTVGAGAAVAGAAAGAAAEALVWAALDCPSGWAGDLENRPMVLGTFTACVDALPQAGETVVIVAAPLGGEGRKAFTASTAYDSDGRMLARAEATWIALRAG